MEGPFFKKTPQSVCPVYFSLPFLCPCRVEGKIKLCTFTCRANFSVEKWRCVCERTFSFQVHVLFPPLNTQNFTRPSEAERKFIRREYSIKVDTKVFAFVSASHKRKGLDILLRIFEQLKDENVLLLIAGYPDVKTDLPNVRFLGFLNAPQIIYHFRPS